MKPAARRTTSNGSRKTLVAAQAREYETLLDKLALNEDDCFALFDYAPRTSRRYRRGDGRVPAPILKLLRLMARGVLTKQQVLRA